MKGFPKTNADITILELVFYIIFMVIYKYIYFKINKNIFKYFIL